MMNLPSYQLLGTTVTARNAEYAGTPLTDVPGAGTYADNVLGCNKAASSAPGIGINTGNIDPKLDDWSVLDQAAAARTPQDSQHIGGNGLGAGDQSNNPVNVVQGTDIDDTLSYIAALAVAAPGVGFGAANGDPINRTDVTLQIGDRAWGTNTI